MTTEIHVRVEFGGGAELLFGNQKKHDVALRSGHKKCTLSDLIMWLKTNLLKGKEELFVQGNTVLLLFVSQCFHLPTVITHLKKLQNIQSSLESNSGLLDFILYQTPTAGSKKHNKMHCWTT
ncbi:ubiquitin-related modifier 1 isoform X1 [Rhipicephalus microplus]|uniref:ubiquitin-related modifier 1 isoform X1 n=1 Tax=Rhipicephalus microplus TaxID=6941 RepID=UPI003F6D128C